MSEMDIVLNAVASMSGMQWAMIGVAGWITAAWFGLGLCMAAGDRR